MKITYLKLRPYFKEISQILFGFLFLVFTMVQCSNIDYNFAKGQTKISAILSEDPIVIKSSENHSSIRLTFGQSPLADLLYSPAHFVNTELPTLETRLNKGDTVVLEIFADDYKRKLLRSPTLTEYFIFGEVSIISIEVKGDKYINSEKPASQQPNFFNVFLIYTVICGFLIIHGYLTLVDKIKLNES